MRMVSPVPVDMTPDFQGLFTLAQVSVLAAKRGLLVYSIDDMCCEVPSGR